MYIQKLIIKRAMFLLSRISFKNKNKLLTISIYKPKLCKDYLLHYFQQHKYYMEAKTRTGLQPQSKYSATEMQGKLFLEINDNAIYKGVIEGSSMYDIKQLKEQFLKGEFHVIVKTTNKICIKLGYLKIELQREMSCQIQELRKKVQELEGKLKNAGQWEEEDLNSTAPFDSNYIYKLNFSNGLSMISCGVTSTTLYFFWGAQYTTLSSNRKANTSTLVVAKMLKFKT